IDLSPDLKTEKNQVQKKRRKAKTKTAGNSSFQAVLNGFFLNLIHIEIMAFYQKCPKPLAL
ncbi:hypothetical protein ACQR3P_31990, partial [Rhodococcus sp. IEGM1300]